MSSTIAGKNVSFNDRSVSVWLDELAIPVAPACNLMCNFCSKDSDCVCNGNSPQFLSRSMTPRQAVNWAVSVTDKNKRIKVLKISGPGEPLFNNQTFEVLRRLNAQLPQYNIGISTNGLLLEEKVNELVQLNVKSIDVCINAISADTVKKLCSRAIKGNFILISSDEMAEILLKSQIKGIKKCIEKGISVKVNTIYFSGINDHEIIEIANMCKRIGVNSIRLISSDPKGKLSRMDKPNLEELIIIQQKLLKILDEVEVKNFA